MNRVQVKASAPQGADLRGTVILAMPRNDAYVVALDSGETFTFTADQLVELLES